MKRDTVSFPADLVIIGYLIYNVLFYIHPEVPSFTGFCYFIVGTDCFWGLTR